MMDMVNFINYEMGNVKIGDSIRTALLSSDINDSFLSRKINVSRQTISNWKKGTITTARQQNLSFLAQELKLELKIESGVAEFQEINLEEIDTMADGITKDIIANQLDHINTLKRENKLLIDDNKLLKKALADMKEKVINFPQLDHNKLQAVVNIGVDRFHIISSKFSALLEYSPIEILNVDYRSFIAPEMMDKVANVKDYYKENKEVLNSLLLKEDEDDTGYSYWTLYTKSKKKVYVKLMTHNIEGPYYFCDAFEISKKEFDDSIALVYKKNYLN